MTITYIAVDLWSHWLEIKPECSIQWLSLFPLSRTLLPQAVEEGEGESQQEEDEEVKRNKEQKWTLHVHGLILILYLDSHWTVKLHRPALQHCTTWKTLPSCK